MTFNGSIKAAISQALTDSKLLVVFLKDSSEASYLWQTQLLTDKQVFGAGAPKFVESDTDLFFRWIVLLTESAVVVSVRDNTRDAAFVASHYAIKKFPSLLVLLNGRVVVGPGKDQLRDSILGCLADLDAALSRPVLLELEKDMDILSQSMEHTIHPAEIAILEKRGVLTPATNGTRRISSSTLLSETSGAILVEAGPSHFIDIPAQLGSEAALRSVGFSDQMAASLWLRWQTRPHDLPWTLEQVVTKISRASPIDAEGPGDDWDGVMKAWGLRESLRGSILTGEFSDIRATRTAQFWAIHSISRFWRSLEIFQQASQRRLLKSKHGVDTMRREIATITSERWSAFH
ncbi:MAG: hypothetical protein HETSPECPRED_006554 [Heterodermia speciosa]|uniref:Uncharacterized protein n=1 Tax=Heterodermia speciosa TaxID=116794 RepID=A0A8H3FMI3_9LECA|nr:MAG: hypothetical protein HETSPECPRED_006554 [Heterodermia speciosa]